MTRIQKKNESGEHAVSEKDPKKENGQNRDRQPEAETAPGRLDGKSFADQFGSGSSQKVESMPTVMLEGGNGSFLGDIINMAKFTRNLYKKK